MYTIGEFSKLCRISARMLRYYDAMNLLRPAHTEKQTGYRYYDASQLSTLAMIETLKKYGFTLSEVQELIALPREEMAERIHIQRLKRHNELHTLRKTLRSMEEDIAKMEGNQKLMEKYHVIVMDTPPQRVFGIRRKIHVGEIGELFDELLKEMSGRGLKRAGATQMLYHGEEFSYENMDVEAQVQVIGDHADVQDIPSQLCVATTHIGPYETVKNAYDAICTWLAQHEEYRVCGVPIERYIKDVDSTADAEEYETGVLFPVKKKQ